MGVNCVPLIDVTHDSAMPEAVIARLGQVLPDIVAEAVACIEEPWTGPPAPGDIEIRFRSKGPFDVGDLDCGVEVRTKLVASRVADKDQRTHQIRERLSQTVPQLGLIGVWLILLEGSWAQST
jgi:hypothetical protein